MSSASVGGFAVIVPGLRSLPLAIRRRVGQLLYLIYPFRPRWRDWRFWVVQGLILAVAGVHYGVEVFQVLQPGSAYDEAALSFVPVALFFIPVVWAAFNFGFVGSVATAFWCTALAVPNLVLFHDGSHRWGEIVQIGIVDAIAVFVGQRIDREQLARKHAEAIGAALQASEQKYRGLFESSPIAVLAIDQSGTILEANPAARSLFGDVPHGQPVTRLADLLGSATAERLLTQGPNEHEPDDCLVLTRADGSAIHLAPYPTYSSNDQGHSVVQIVFRDVTGEHSRQAGLRAYAASILLAQEEERKRIARDLHDETVQQLILLCRQLDAVESAGRALDSLAVARLDEARRSAENVIGGLRCFARALRPPTLDDLGLVASLRRLLVDLDERANTEGQIEVIGEERRLPPNVETALFRIAQEALRNVERHARAAHVVVTVAFDENAARLDVVDDGIGFVLPTSRDFATGGQLGLLGMRERAESLGGRLGLQSCPGTGTRLVVSIPVPVADSPAPDHRPSTTSSPAP